jgi:putative ABC transport system ATP-binding protein
MTILRLEDITIEYTSGDYVVRPIDGLNLQFEDGELVLLLGASGSGKTTLLSAMASLLTPAGGRIFLDDLEITGLGGSRLRDFRRNKIGVVFQAFNLLPSLTALENVMVPLRAAGWTRRRAREHAAQILGDLGIGERLDHLPHDLSGGQQQRVAIARALALDPPLLLADEPTAHLDFIAVEGVIELLRRLASPGRIIVVSTHDDRFVPLADRVVELTPRTIARTRPPERLTLGAGQVLFRQGDAGDLVFVVEEGELEMVRVVRGGGEEVVHRVGPGRYFGELSPVLGTPRSATARAAVPSVVTGYSLRDFRDLGLGDPTKGEAAAGAPEVPAP